MLRAAAILVALTLSFQPAYGQVYFQSANIFKGSTVKVFQKKSYRAIEYSRLLPYVHEVCDYNPSDVLVNKRIVTVAGYNDPKNIDVFFDGKKYSSFIPPNPYVNLDARTNLVKGIYWTNSSISSVIKRDTYFDNCQWPGSKVCIVAVYGVVRHVRPAQIKSPIWGVAGAVRKDFGSGGCVLDVEYVQKLKIVDYDDVVKRRAKVQSDAFWHDFWKGFSIGSQVGGVLVGG